MDIIDKIKEIKYNRLSKEEKQEIINQKNCIIAGFIKGIEYLPKEEHTFYYANTIGKWSTPRPTDINYELNFGLDINGYRIGHMINPNELKFNSNWEWIMTAIIKIESLDLNDKFYQWKDGNQTRNNFQGISVDISKNNCWIGINLDLDPPITINKKSSHKHFNTKIEAVWTAVNEFIEWYDENIDKYYNS